MAIQIQTALTILRRAQVEAATGLSRSTIYQRIKEGTFPAPVQLGPRAVGWRAGDIDVFLANPAGYKVAACPRPPANDAQRCRNKRINNS